MFVHTNQCIYFCKPNHKSNRILRQVKYVYMSINMWKKTTLKLKIFPAAVSVWVKNIKCKSHFEHEKLVSELLSHLMLLVSIGFQFFIWFVALSNKFQQTILTSIFPYRLKLNNLWNNVCCYKLSQNFASFNGD